MSDDNQATVDGSTVQEYVDNLMANWPEPTDELNQRIAAIFNG